MEWREIIDRLSRSPAYEGGISAAQAAKYQNISVDKFINLQSNENLFISSSYLKSILRAAIREFNPQLYPKDEIGILEENLASYVNVKPENIMLGSGADQLIDFLISLFGSMGSVAYPVPTYSYYGISSEVRGIKKVEVPYNEDFSLDVDRLVNAASTLTFICSPNNPTGHSVKLDQLRELLERGRSLVVVDETYAEFLGMSFAPLIKKYDNLLILRSMSKSFGIASLRVGYMIGDAEIISNLKKAQLPFVISSLAARVSVKLLQNLSYFRSRWREAIATMKKFLSMLDISVQRTPTETYFVTISTCRSNTVVFNELLRYGYITRIIKPFMNFRNPLRLSVAPFRMISDLPDLINNLNKC